MTLVLMAISFTGCTHLDRHENSGYKYAGETDTTHSQVQQFYIDQSTNEKNIAYAELGLDPYRSLSEEDSKRLRLRLQLKRIEQRLITESERKQYYFYKPMLRSDAERIFFLNLNNMALREKYAKDKDLISKFHDFDDATLQLIEENDIGVGMNQQAVRESWGDPDSVEVAGSEMYGNQAWRYTKMISSNEGYKKETRIIYFESGRVVGWESL